MTAGHHWEPLQREEFAEWSALSLDALIANMAMILASSSSAATPDALDIYCRGATEQLRGKTLALRATPEAMRAIRSEIVPTGARRH